MPFSRREFISRLGTAGVLGLTGQGLRAADAPRAPRRPNLLILQPDQHRADVAGFAGNVRAHTPHLDRLAREGTAFLNCISATPVCSPWRGCMQTGVYPHLHGVWHNNLRLDDRCLGFAETLGRAGYTTGYIGKWHLEGIGGEDGGPEAGFVPEGKRRFGWQEWLGYDKSHEYFNVSRFDPKTGEKRSVPGYDWEPAWQTDMTLDFIRRHRTDAAPWAYYVAYGPPHPPEECHDRFLRQFDPASFVLPSDIAGKFSASREAEIRRLWQMYYAQVAAVDWEVGRILQGLEDLGVSEDTIVVYTSDHGDVLGSHRAETGNPRGKAAPYRTAFRTPLLLRWPGQVRAGHTERALISSLDLPPTLLRLLGIDVPSAMQGEDFSPACLGRSFSPRREVYLGLGEPNAPKAWRGVYDGRHIFSCGSFNVLYDHAADPDENQNLYDRREARGRREELGRTLLRLAGAAKDPHLATLEKTFGPATGDRP